MLDGHCPASLELSPAPAEAYSAESMRLTTRLMQIASWLLIRRAIADGEMSAAEALGERRATFSSQNPHHAQLDLSAAAAAAAAADRAVPQAPAPGRPPRSHDQRRACREPDRAAGGARRSNMPCCARPLARSPDGERRSSLLAEGHPGEAGVEARQAAAAVEQLLAAAGPGRMGQRVDVKVQRVTVAAEGRARGEGGAVRHHHLDEVIVGMGVGLHR